MSSKGSSQSLSKTLNGASIKPCVKFENPEELGDMMLEKFIALNPLYLIDEDEGEEELAKPDYISDSSLSDF